MISESIINNIESLSSELVLADPENDKDIENIYSRLNTVKAQLSENDFPNTHKAFEAVSVLVKQCLADREMDREKLFGLLNETMSVTQNVICSRFKDHEVVYPKWSEAEEKSADIDRQSGEFFSLPIHIDEDILNEFLGEQDSVLQRIEENLLSIEKKSDPEALAELKRIFHTLKGESGVFGLTGVERICHATEDLIESSTDDLPFDKLFYVKDWLHDVFEALKQEKKLPRLDENLLEQVSPKPVETPLAEPQIIPPRIEEKVDPESTEDVEKEKSKEGRVDEPEAKTEYSLIGDIDLLTDFISEVQEHIDAIDNKLLELENNPEDSELLNSVFRVFHTIKGAAGFLALNDMAELAHTTENLLDMARRGTIKLTGGRIDHVFDAIDAMKRLVDNIRQAISKGTNVYVSDSSSKSVIADIEKCVKEKANVQARSKEDTPVVNENKNENQLAENKEPEKTEKDINDYKNNLTEPEVDNKAAQYDIVEEITGGKNEILNNVASKISKIKEAIKVDSENLDKLIDAIGELVIIESMIRQDSDIKRVASSHLLRNIAQMEKITRELQQLGMSLRMIPVKATFQKMARVVRDLAKKSGKKIEFTTLGEDTMLDKSIVDRIGDPLIHLVRNCVDHGIEDSSEQRKEAGKNEVGTVELRAFHKGGNIYIEIKDDGKGLDRKSVLNKAVERGLVEEGESLTETEIYNLIFLPGFSTAKKVTDVSGRGVGMDVVKRAMEELRGNIDISSEPGIGTRFSLRLPLTLAIIDGMILRIGSERYIIPTLSIVEALRPKPQDVHTVAKKGEMIKVRDKLIPLFRLYKLFKIEGANTEPTESIIVIVEDSGKMTALLADELLGQQSIVIKNLGASMEGLTGISGGSIMSDGKVGVILDVAGIVRLATSKTENQKIGVLQ